MDVVKLYPQYNITKERRAQSMPVSFERRSGVERRLGDRVQLDTNLTRDLFEVRSKVSQLQTSAKQKAENIVSAQKISMAPQINKDEFIRTKPANDNPKPIEKTDTQEGALGLALGAIFGGAVASTFLGSAGIGIALGLGVYFGGRLLKEAVSHHITKK